MFPVRRELELELNHNCAKRLRWGISMQVDCRLPHGWPHRVKLITALFPFVQKLEEKIRRRLSELPEILLLRFLGPLRLGFRLFVGYILTRALAFDLLDLPKFILLVLQFR